MKGKNKVGDQGRWYDGEYPILSLNSQEEISLNIKRQSCNTCVNTDAIS